MITQNAARAKGPDLVNGEVGKTIDIETDCDGLPRALALNLNGRIIKVRKISGSVEGKSRRKAGSIFVTSADGGQRFVRLKRSQFPVLPFYSITIHKPQGATLDSVVVGFSDDDAKFTFGMAYVALSRV